MSARRSGRFAPLPEPGVLRASRARRGRAACWSTRSANKERSPTPRPDSSPIPAGCGRWLPRRVACGRLPSCRSRRDDGTEIGLVIAMWASNRRQLPASARQAAELLSDEAGRMFQRMRDSAALVHDAETDPLTELANRRTFQRALEVMQPGDALVIVDLDHFKKVNDRYGHQVGDNTLRLLASCLRGTARQVDCVARYGGEEFAMVLPEAGASGAKSLLRRVRREWVACDGRTTFSAGIAVHEEGRSSRDTLRLADEALYAAKENGRNRDVLAFACQPSTSPSRRNPPRWSLAGWQVLAPVGRCGAGHLAGRGGSGCDSGGRDGGRGCRPRGRPRTVTRRSVPRFASRNGARASNISRRCSRVEMRRAA